MRASTPAAVGQRTLGLGVVEIINAAWFMLAGPLFFMFVPSKIPWDTINQGFTYRTWRTVFIVATIGFCLAAMGMLILGWALRSSRPAAQRWASVWWCRFVPVVAVGHVVWLFWCSFLGGYLAGIYLIQAVLIGLLACDGYGILRRTAAIK